jgi:hypothetical protein
MLLPKLSKIFRTPLFYELICANNSFIPFIWTLRWEHAELFLAESYQYLVGGEQAEFLKCQTVGYNRILPSNEPSNSSTVSSARFCRAEPTGCLSDWIIWDANANLTLLSYLLIFRWLFVTSYSKVVVMLTNHCFHRCNAPLAQKEVIHLCWKKVFKCAQYTCIRDNKYSCIYVLWWPTILHIFVENLII